MKLIIQCETCEGSGIHYEPHDYGTHEALGCMDCQAKGTVEMVGIPIPWCSEHDEQMTDTHLDIFARYFGVNRCVLEPQQVYRIGQP